MKYVPFFGLLAGLIIFAAITAAGNQAPTPPTNPAPAPAPPPPAPPKPCPGPGPCPRPRPRASDVIGTPHEGGPLSDGLEVAVDLPVSLRVKNVGGRDGAGLCVFTSIMHSARYQNERALWDFQSKMRSELGGGWPEKVDRMIAKYAPGTRYLQYEGSNPEVLEAALKSGRMPGVTYNGHDSHYGGTIAHMVNLVYLDANAACILDNNFIGDNQLEWMTRQDFLQRWTGGRSGWAVVLLAPAPAPVPHN